jgi:DNA-binding winged helix-turn-helix (wHTH) protein
MRFGPFDLDPQPGHLWRGDEIIMLHPRAFDMLCYLSARPGYLIPREELLHQVWKGVHVSGAMVGACIHDIRTALGDKASSPQYLKTVGRQDYRFLGGWMIPRQNGGAGGRDPTRHKQAGRKGGALCALSQR